MLVSAVGVAAVFATTGVLATHHARPGGELPPVAGGGPTSFLSLAARLPAARRAARAQPLNGAPRVAQVPSSGAAASRRKELPSPPSPYAYESFMQWFGSHDWAAMNLPMTPAQSWFDVDAAMSKGPRKAWFADKDMTAVAALAKRVNRFLFMEQIMLSGSDDAQSSMPMHLLILWLLRKDLNVSRSTTVLDAGCGDGWLATAFALMRRNPESQVSGFDIEGVEQARRNVASQEVADHPLQPPLPELFYGNLLADGFGVNRTITAELQPSSFDAINVGAALRSDNATSPTFQRLARLLKKGGALTVPICKAPPDSTGHCKADFRLYRRSEEGEVVKQVHGQYNVTFLVVEPAPDSEATA